LRETVFIHNENGKDEEREGTIFILTTNTPRGIIRVQFQNVYPSKTLNKFPPYSILGEREQKVEEESLLSQKQRLQKTTTNHSRVHPTPVETMMTPDTRNGQVVSSFGG
jgi:hypothetical protein